MSAFRPSVFIEASVKGKLMLRCIASAMDSEVERSGKRNREVNVIVCGGWGGSGGRAPAPRRSVLSDSSRPDPRAPAPPPAASRVTPRSHITRHVLYTRQ